VKIYRLTPLGRKRLEVEKVHWRRIATAMAHALESGS
jgi:DNA-binding PadR family transcriptional regulator